MAMCGLGSCTRLNVEVARKSACKQTSTAGRPSAIKGNFPGKESRDSITMAADSKNSSFQKYSYFAYQLYCGCTVLTVQYNDIYIHSTKMYFKFTPSANTVQVYSIHVAPLTQ